jgi:thiol-disulfide isomerase/thioredoxin
MKLKNYLKYKIFIIFFIFLLNIPFSLYSEESGYIFNIGDNFYNEINLQVGLKGVQIPDITKELKGKPLLAVGVATTCPYCTSFLSTVNKIYPNYRGLFNVMLAVVDFRNAEKYINQYPEFIIFPASFTGFNRLTSVPYFVLLDRQGNILFQHKGNLSEYDLTKLLDYLVKNY